VEAKPKTPQVKNSTAVREEREEERGDVSWTSHKEHEGLSEIISPKRLKNVDRSSYALSELFAEPTCQTSETSTFSLDHSFLYLLHTNDTRKNSLYVNGLIFPSGARKQYAKRNKREFLRDFVRIIPREKHSS
jgi:hypothetical protein